MDLPLEIWELVTRFIRSDKYICHLMMTCKEISKCGFYFYELVDANEIKNSGWFDRFVFISVTNRIKLHSNVRGLYFSDDFNKFINGYIPSSVKYLKFGKEFNQSVFNCIPSSVIQLEFGEKFNRSIKGCIPSHVFDLKFGNDFNQPIDDIPSSVINLKFGLQFNQSVDNLPSSIECLTFGDMFNQPVNNLPSSIQCIYFGFRFNQPINNLPNSLIYLVLGNDFNQPIKGCIPTSVTNIRLNGINCLERVIWAKQNAIKGVKIHLSKEDAKFIKSLKEFLS